MLLLFVGGAVAGAVWVLGSRKEQRPNIAAVIAIPFGLAAAPIVGIVMFAVIGNRLERSDTALYEEVFGYRPTITEDRMLSHDFGQHRSREIFMRVEPTDAERNRIVSIPNAVESALTPDAFIARGLSHGLGWWLSGNERNGKFCKSVRIVDAHGFRDWSEFHVAECLDAGTEFSASANKGMVYIIASGRGE